MGKKLNTEQKRIISEIVEDRIDDIFVELHQEFGTKSGDITPEQVFELERIRIELEDLLTRQINQNL